VAAPTETPVDGRNARRERGRQAVIDAVVQLLREGYAPPSTALVVERAGVSEATLYRYFDTITDLQFLATQRFLEQYSRLFEVPREGQGDLDQRIDRFVAARAELWGAIAPVAKLGRARAYDHPGMAELLAEARRNQAAQVARQFSVELAQLPPSAREDLVADAAVATSFEAWDFQRTDLGRTPAQVRRAWRTALRALFTSTGVRRP
jgi:AcrR family transcriptional regulator